MSMDLWPSFLAVRKKREALPEKDKSAEFVCANLRAAMMPHQRRLLDSPARRDAVISPRQTGKSWAVLLLIFWYCCRAPNQSWVLIGPTLKSLKRIYLPVFRCLNAKFSLGIKHNKSDFTFTFPNGSIIYFFGADKTDEAEKLRGSTLNGVVVDEAQHYPLDHFDSLLQDVVEPALRIKRGRLIIVGTPGEVLMGEFYMATAEKPIMLGEPPNQSPSNYPVGGIPNGLWCRHHWTPQDNIADPKGWEDSLELKRLRGWSDTHPKWQREYLGKWVTVTEFFVYGSFQPYVNVYDGTLPTLGAHDEPWRYVLGVDLGAKDGTAMVVWAYSSSHPNLYQVYGHKECSTDTVKITNGFIARWRNDLERQFGAFEMEVCDAGGLGGLILDSLAEQHSIYWEPAEKNQKEDHIKLLNDEFEDRRVFLLAGGELALELATNRWQKDRNGNVPPPGRRTEDPLTPNDLCDAALYAFRWCYHRFFRVVEKKPFSAVLEAYERERDAIRALQEGRQAKDTDDPCWNLS